MQWDFVNIANPLNVKVCKNTVNGGYFFEMNSL